MEGTLETFIPKGFAYPVGVHIRWLDFCLGFPYTVNVHIDDDLESWPECHMDRISILV